MTPGLLMLIIFGSVFGLIGLCWWLAEHGPAAVGSFKAWITLRQAHDVKTMRRNIAKYQDKQAKASIKRLKKAEDKSNREYIVGVVDHIRKSGYSIVDSKQVADWFASRGFNVETHIDNTSPRNSRWKITVDPTDKELSDIIVK